MAIHGHTYFGHKCFYVAKNFLSYDKEVHRVTKIFITWQINLFHLANSLVFLSNEHPVNRTILIINIGGVKFPATEPYTTIFGALLPGLAVPHVFAFHSKFTIQILGNTQKIMLNRIIPTKILPIKRIMYKLYYYRNGCRGSYGRVEHGGGKAHGRRETHPLRHMIQVQMRGDLSWDLE